MRGYVILALTVGLLGATYFKAAKKPDLPERLLLATAASVDEAGACIGINGRLAKEDLEKKPDVIAQGTVQPLRRERVVTTFASRDRELQVTIRQGPNGNEIRVRSSTPLSPNQISLFRSCINPDFR